MAAVQIARVEVGGTPAGVQLARLEATYATPAHIQIQLSRLEVTSARPVDMRIARGGVWVDVLNAYHADTGSWS